MRLREAERGVRAVRRQRQRAACSARLRRHRMRPWHVRRRAVRVSARSWLLFADRGADIVGGRLRDGNLRLGLRRLRAIVARIDAHQRLCFSDVLIVDHPHRSDIAGGARRHRRRSGADLHIIGRLKIFATRLVPHTKRYRRSRPPLLPSVRQASPVRPACAQAFPRLGRIVWGILIRYGLLDDVGVAVADGAGRARQSPAWPTLRP